MLKSAKILVVDDNRHMRTIHKTVLRALGARVLEAADGQNALEVIDRERPDLIVTDFEMPRLSGAEMVERLRRSTEPGKAQTPVVMVTGHAGASRIFAARDAGVNEVCTKPVSPAGLWKRLAAVINHDRPFVRATHYVGPCRRRRAVPVRVERRGQGVLEI